MELNLPKAVAGSNEQDKTWGKFTLVCSTALRRLQRGQQLEGMSFTRYRILNSEQQLIKTLLCDSWEMKKHIRLSRESFRSILRLLATPEGRGWDQEAKLAIFLFWLASGASLRAVSSAFHVPKSTIHNMVHEMMKKVVSLRCKVFKFPMPEELPLIGRGFATLAGHHEFKIVAGAIDGCHVEVMVRGPHQADYLNRKLLHSVHFQAVCDHTGKFLHVFAGYPGSVKDSRVFKESSLFTAAVYPPKGYALLGDSEYPCQCNPVTLLTPFKEPVKDPIQSCFNAHHHRGRKIIEKAFGMLKARWSCIFMQKVQLKHTRVSEVIGACCIMHNICIDNGDLLQGVVVAESEPPVSGQDLGDPEGFSMRENLAQKVAKEPMMPPGHLMDHDYV